LAVAKHVAHYCCNPNSNSNPNPNPNPNSNFIGIDIYASPIARGELKQSGTTKLMQSGSPLD